MYIHIYMCVINLFFFFHWALPNNVVFLFKSFTLEENENVMVTHAVISIGKGLTHRFTQTTNSYPKLETVYFTLDCLSSKSWLCHSPRQVTSTLCFRFIPCQLRLLQHLPQGAAVRMEWVRAHADRDNYRPYGHEVKGLPVEIKRRLWSEITGAT